MIRYQIRLILRNFKRQKGSFFINMAGLSVAFACVILISMWVKDELSVDKFHKNDQQLYQVLQNEESGGQIITQGWTPDLLARTLAEEMPEVEMAAAVTPSSFFGSFALSTGGDNIIKAAGQFAGKDFFKMFSYGLVQGNAGQVLADKNAIVISKKLAMALFNTTENVIGRTITWQLLNFKKEVVVSGIFNGTPKNSSTQFDFVLPFEAWLSLSKKIGRGIQWGNNAPLTFLLLHKGTNVDQLNHKLAGFMKTKIAGSTDVLFAVRYSSEYLHGKYENGIQSGGRIEYIRLFLIVALFILLIAGINFMNLSTAQASRRFKEVGIKKVMGSKRRALVLQFMGEAVIISVLALFLSFVLVALFLPQFNQITGKHLSLDFHAGFILPVFIFSLITGMLSGIYPALYLSGFNILNIMKGESSKSFNELLARKGLVVFQFSISVILIVVMLVTYKQIEFVRNKNLGYQKDNVLFFSKEGNIAQKQGAFLAEVRKIPGVIDASTMGGNLLGSFSTTYGVGWEGKDPNTDIRFEAIPVDYHLLETMKIQMKQGRSFSDKYGDEANKIILNEAAVKVMGLKHPVGQTIQFWGQEKQVIGVVKNFNFQSLHSAISPAIIRLDPGKTLNVMVRIDHAREKQTLASLKKLYDDFNHGYPFDYQFMDAAYQALYVSDQRVSSLSRYFAGLGIFISCLGLFGLATFAAEQRSKEIGIRKVNGAKVSEVMAMLNKDFVKWVAVAFVIATPVAWYAMNLWLEDFAYRTSLSWWIFVLAGFLALVIALLTVSWHSYRAATRNPIEALRYE